MQPLIELRGVRFAYGAGPNVLEHVEFTVLPKERVALIGPIGCGKSTLLQLLVGLLKPTEGTVLAFGSERRVEGDFLEVRRRVGLVFQDPDDQLFCPTVLEDVAFGPLNLGKSPDEATEVARETLTLLGLSGFEDRITYKLSGGEKRLVAIATVLSMRPEVLLLDEPINGLDEVSRDRVEGVLRELPQALVVTGHERGLGERLGCKTTIMEEGKLR